jgi:DNA-binding transcriptional ArsR family regulator
MVSYSAWVEEVFKALADPTRRELLDELFRRDGQTLGALAGRFTMTRVAVAKHLRVLEAAGLVATRRRGREKLHYLNPVPIRLIHDRWVNKYNGSRRFCSTDQVVIAGEGCRLGAGGRPELGEDPRYVHPGRVDADEQLDGDLAVGHTDRHQAQHVQFAGGQAEMRRPLPCISTSVTRLGPAAGRVLNAEPGAVR